MGNANDSGWSSWASPSAWKQWGSSMIDTEAWSASINGWMEYFNMNMEAEEIWKIDWILHRATSLVKNVSMSWTVRVDEYTELEQLMHVKSSSEEEEKDEGDDNVKVMFVKKLFVSPIVPMP